MSFDSDLAPAGHLHSSGHGQFAGRSSDISTSFESSWNGSSTSDLDEWREKSLQQGDDVELELTGDELTGDELDSFDEYDAAQQEWDESLHQLQTLFALTLIPVAGKYLGRRFAHYCECTKVWSKRC